MSFTPAKVIDSPQEGIHKDLQKIVSKHLESEFKRPIAAYNQEAFNQFLERKSELGDPKIILDSACGTGESTRYFTHKYPDHLVVGLDQSAKRLANNENKKLADNGLLLRCDCTDFWRLMEQEGIKADRHFLLYPNPWPKTQHLQRRWHGHPTFKNLLAVSESIELRTNWRIYAQEFNAALGVAKRYSAIDEYKSDIDITAFERKYRLSSHALWRVCTIVESALESA